MTDLHELVLLSHIITQVRDKHKIKTLLKLLLTNNDYIYEIIIDLLRSVLQDKFKAYFYIWILITLV